jgi:hypothetical protein
MLGWIERGGDLSTLCEPSIIGFPRHIGDLTLWSNVFLRIAVALQAPLHRDRLHDPNDLHLVDASVT